MLNLKLTYEINREFKKAIPYLLSFLLLLFLFNGCLLVRFDAHFATKGTKIGSDEKKAEMQSNTFGMHLKHAFPNDYGAPPAEAAEHGDTQIGAGAELKIGPKLGKTTEILGVLGYDRYYYFVGNDDFVKLGLQGRKTFKDDRFWLGLEGSYVKDWAYLKNNTENPDVGMAGYIFNPATRKLEYRRTRKANGWMAGLLGGYKINLIKSLDTSVFAGAFLMHLGDFTTKMNEVTKEPHYNLHFKAGIEVALPFSK
jgi:hypothetical protein